jgi:hypothetical protein
MFHHVARDPQRMRRASAFGPMLTLSVFFAHIVGVAKPWAGVLWRATAAVGAKGAPTALRCSGFGRTA